MEGAIADYGTAIRFDPEMVDAYLRRGVSHSKLFRFKEAIEDLDQFILRSAPDAVAYRARGLAYYGLGEWERAIEDFDQAIASDPDLALAFNDRGLSLVNLGRHADAIKDFDMAVKLSPDVAVFYHNRAGTWPALRQPLAQRRLQLLGGRDSAAEGAGLDFVSFSACSSFRSHSRSSSSLCASCSSHAWRCSSLCASLSLIHI